MINNTASRLSQRPRTGREFTVIRTGREFTEGDGIHVHTQIEKGINDFLVRNIIIKRGTLNKFWISHNGVFSAAVNGGAEDSVMGSGLP